MRNIWSMKLAVSVSLVMLLSAAVAQESSKAASAFDQQLIEQQKQFLQAMQAKNPSVIERGLADDFVGIGTNGDFYDKGEILEAAQEGSEKVMRAYDFHVIKLNDDAAIVAYNLVLPGEHPRYRHMADTWARSNGHWKLKFRQITPNLWSANDLD